MKIVNDMKIAYLLGSLSRGGTETLLLDVFRNADKAEFEFIGIHRKHGALKDDFYATAPKFIQLAPRFPFDIFYFFKLRKILKKERIQIVHAQQYLDALYAWIATRFSKIKVVLTFHGYDNFEKKDKWINLIIKRTDKNIFVSHFQKEYYIRKYDLKPEKQVVIYNGISFDKFCITNVILDLPQKFPTLRGLKICMVGNFVRVREQNSVCRFLKLLADKDVTFDFYFVGKKNEAEPWRYDDCVKYCQENRIGECVHFLGSRNDVPAILKQMDAFVYSTNHDTFGIAVIEAIAAGLPVFVNDWGVMKEIINNGEFATLYKTKNENDLLSKFLLFLQDKEKYKVEAQNAAIEVRKLFSIERHINELSKLYNNL
ncbi:glycosyl transferase family 1 [Bacteroidia bacterium]|nr:glycosyl transferase family 1 [Bacteroidia bacterium]